VYDAYGLYAVKDFTHRTKAKINALERKAKRNHEHHSGGEMRMVSKRLPAAKAQNIISDTVSKNTYVARKDKETIADVTKPVANLRINFAFDKDTISVRDMINIKEYMQKIPLETTADILIKGFTDNAGTKAYNKHLSINRAKRVYDYLILLGIPSSKLSFKGFDFKDPVADNKTEEGRSLNRRVEIEIVFIGNP